MGAFVLKGFFYVTVSWKKKRGINWTADVKMVSPMLITWEHFIKYRNNLKKSEDYWTDRTHFFIFNPDNIPNPLSSSHGFSEVIQNLSTENPQ